MSLLLGQFEGSITVLVRIVGLAVLAGLVSGTAAIVFRWYARDQIPRHLAILVGLGAIAIWLNSLVALSQYIEPIDAPLTPAAAAVDVAAFIAGGFTAALGRRGGDRIALRSSAFAGRGLTGGDLGDLNQLVRTGGRVITLTVPDEIEDITGYDPVDGAVKSSLSGTTFHFPRGLTVTELRERFVARLREEYDVGHIDVDLAPEGTIEYLALGSRAAGLGPTLSPGTVAVALRADPAPDATPGDTVQVWRSDSQPRHLATGEFRGCAGDVVTLALDARDAEELDRETAYRLATLPANARADREFATMLRAADETMSVATVAAGSELDGATVGDIDATVVAVESGDEPVKTIPSRTHVLEAGDVVYAIARPERLRQLKSVASAQEKPESSRGSISASSPESDR